MEIKHLHDLRDQKSPVKTEDSELSEVAANSR